MKVSSLIIGLLVYWIIGLFSLAHGQEQDATQPGKSIRDNLRERVEERLAQLSQKPRAFVGKITQITDGSLMLTTRTGTKQVKVKEDAIILQVGNRGQKTVKPSDLALENFVIAMGILEDKDTLNASRILMSTENPLLPRRPVYGVVQETGSGTLVVKHPKKEDEAWTIKFSSSTRVSAKVDTKIEKVNANTIEVGDRIIAVGSLVSGSVNTITAKLIHVIPGKATGLLSPEPSPSPTQKPSPTP
ncbi:hypothetical protein HYV21_02150 [Candidatus Microgenomates bacterium]|nr:hypothetical protein [Candidatus Microgenomates bacterium]